MQLVPFCTYTDRQYYDTMYTVYFFVVLFHLDEMHEIRNNPEITVEIEKSL